MESSLGRIRDQLAGLNIRVGMMQQQDRADKKVIALCSSQSVVAPYSLENVFVKHDQLFVCLPIYIPSWKCPGQLFSPPGDGEGSVCDSQSVGSLPKVRINHRYIRYTVRTTSTTQLRHQPALRDQHERGLEKGWAKMTFKLLQQTDISGLSQLFHCSKVNRTFLQVRRPTPLMHMAFYVVLKVSRSSVVNSVCALCLKPDATLGQLQ